MNKLTESRTCLFTGLEIIESNHWKNLKLSENYVITFRKIGTHVVDIHGYGNIINFDADRFQKYLDNFIQDQGMILPFVEIRNFEDLQGLLPSKRSLLSQKTHFIENKEKRIGFVAYNTSKAIAMVLKSGLKQYKRINISIAIESDYEHAIQRALKIIDEYKPYKKVVTKHKKYKIYSDEIEEVALSCGKFLWEENDLFDIDSLKISSDHPLYSIVENLAIVREEIIQLENESYKKSEALETEKQQTEKIVESLQSGIIIVDAHKDLIVDVNPAACFLLAGEKEKIIGKPFSQFLMNQQKFKDYHLTREESSESYLVTLKDEVIPVNRSSVKIKLKDKQYNLENFVDISEAKKHEDKLRKSLAQTKQLNNLTVNREKRIIEMKREVNGLLSELGRDLKYQSVVVEKEE